MKLVEKLIFTNFKVNLSKGIFAPVKNIKKKVGFSFVWVTLSLAKTRPRGRKHSD